MRIVERFGAADDPDYEGKLLIELYHAQFRTALSECFGPEAEPSLAAAGCGLAAQYLLAIGSSANAHQVDAIALRKLLQMLCKPLSPATLAAGTSRYATYSESAATMVHVEALQAAARLQATARGADAAHFGELQSQLAPYLPSLRDVWLALLRDHAMLHTQVIPEPEPEPEPVP